MKVLGSVLLFWYNFCVKEISTGKNYSPKQGRLPVFLAESLEICDPVLAFDEIMEEIGIERYLKPEGYKQSGQYAENDLVRLYGHRLRIVARAGRPLQGESAVHVFNGLRSAQLSLLRRFHQ